MMIDVSELEDYVRRVEAASRDLRPYAAKTLEEVGNEFLEIVQAEIQRKQNVDMGKLLASFSKGGPGNIYRLDSGGLTLTIGTNVEYAQWVNDGHRQRPGRFVPGVWEGKHFRYIPGAGTGMVLKASWVKGSHFFDDAKRAFELIFQQYVDSAFEQFWARYF